MQNPYELFFKEAPQVAQSFHALIQSLSSSKALDDKTRQLIYIAMKAADGDSAAVTAHVGMAKAAGATRDQVKDAILMSLVVSGVKGVMRCLPDALQAYDR